MRVRPKALAADLLQTLAPDVCSGPGGSVEKARHHVSPVKS